MEGKTILFLCLSVCLFLSRVQNEEEGWLKFSSADILD